MATPSRSPTRRAAPGPAAGKKEVSPQQLAERVKELEAADKEAKKLQAKETKQRQRELADAKKKLAKELQAANRLVQKGEREAKSLTTKTDQVDKQEEQTKAKAARQQALIDEKVGKMQQKRHGIEATLHEKMSIIGEARGRLAHAAFAAKMLEAGIIVPLDGTADFNPAPPPVRRRRRAPGAEGGDAEGGGEEGEDYDEEGAESELDDEGVAALREENRQLRESLREALAEIERLKARSGLADGGDATQQELDLDEQPLQPSDAHLQTSAPTGFQAPGMVQDHKAPALPLQAAWLPQAAVGPPQVNAAGFAQPLAGASPQAIAQGGGAAIAPFGFSAVPSQGGSAMRGVSPMGPRIVAGGIPMPGPRHVVGAGGGGGHWAQPSPIGVVGPPHVAVHRQTSGPGWVQGAAPPLHGMTVGAVSAVGAGQVGTSSTATPSPRTPFGDMSSPEAKRMMASAPMLLPSVRHLATPTKPKMMPPMEPLAGPPQLAHMAGAPPAE